MSRFTSNREFAKEPVRLVLSGTRVIVIKPDAPRIAGIVTEVRTAAGLRPYVVICDDGARIYASSHDLALEGDATRTPLRPPPQPD